MTGDHTFFPLGPFYAGFFLRHDAASRTIGGCRTSRQPFQATTVCNAAAPYSTGMILYGAAFKKIRVNQETMPWSSLTVFRRLFFGD